MLASACGADVVYPENIVAVCRDNQPRSLEQIMDDLAAVDLRNSDQIKIDLKAVERLTVWSNQNDVYLRANADQGPVSYCQAILIRQCWEVQQRKRFVLKQRRC